MKHDVNQLLLGLLFMACLGMILIVVYYNMSFDLMSEKYDESVGNVRNMSSALSSTLNEVQEKEALLAQKEALLEEYLNELNLSRRRESTLGTHYENLSAERSRLENDLSGMTSERDRWKGMYGDVRDEADVCSAELRIKSMRIVNLESDMSSAVLKISETTVVLNEISDLLVRLERDLKDLDELAGGNSTIKAEINSARAEKNNIALEVANAKTLLSNAKNILQD
ncbi:MAG TPA: hypothetical protein ENN13_02620 [Candidatus Altiarchaeales archaeon]|nr:hypothetical protein [Candidatus Altiarchaeales archaeon]